jgi:hypothetical protein
MAQNTGNAKLIAYLIIIPLLIFVYGNIFFSGGIWNNFLSQDIHAASIGWHVMGWILTAAWIMVYFWNLNSDSSTGKIALIGVLLVVAICAFAGFNFQFA